ncbi:MAG: hypothetical protein IJP81_00900, partial [Bacteroidales bacterium]|nr:hypothetical protein [Bacteroidales bacterium]
MEEKLSTKYNDAVQQIKAAILKSQTKALASVNQEQLALYYGIGRFISNNSRAGFWGKDAIETISRQLSSEMPGLRGFSPRNLRNMRTFYEQWSALDSNLADASAKLQSTDNSADTSAKLPVDSNIVSAAMMEIHPGTSCPRSNPVSSMTPVSRAASMALPRCASSLPRAISSTA